MRRRGGIRGRGSPPPGGVGIPAACATGMLAPAQRQYCTRQVEEGEHSRKKSLLVNVRRHFAIMLQKYRVEGLIEKAGWKMVVSMTSH